MTPRKDVAAGPELWDSLTVAEFLGLMKVPGAKKESALKQVRRLPIPFVQYGTRKRLYRPVDVRKFRERALGGAAAAAG